MSIPLKHRQSGTSGQIVVKGPFHITHATPNLSTGVVLWTPAVGEIILGSYSLVTEAFDVDAALAGGAVFGTAAAINDPSYAPFLGGTGFPITPAGAIDPGGGRAVVTGAATPFWLGTTEPIVAVIVGAAPPTTGTVDLYVIVLPA